MEKGLAALASIFAILAAWLIYTALNAGSYDAYEAQMASMKILLGMGSGIVAAVLFGSAAIVDAIRSTKQPRD